MLPSVKPRLGLFKTKTKTETKPIGWNVFSSPHLQSLDASFAVPPGLGLLSPQSVRGHQIHVPRTLLLTRRFPAGKALMIPRRLEGNLVSRCLQAGMIYLLDSHAPVLSDSPSEVFTNRWSSSVYLIPTHTLPGIIQGWK